jgi:crossover junction endodeoxyribonuclease RuvC
MRVRILGIDPGIATVGFSILDSDGFRQKLVGCGVITTPAHTSLSSRLDRIYTDMAELITTYHPDSLAVEELFFNTNITTGISVAHGRGVVLLCAYQAGLQIYEYTPMQVKQAVVGYGLAEKHQVMDMTRRLLKLKMIPKPDDAADALAIAICHTRSATSLLRRHNPDVKETV